jgi:mannose/fructose/N-acetylgalactosamine-specific phosphotransferase system component IIC
MWPSLVGDLSDLFMLTMLGALLGLDVVSFPQAQVSRPLVAATVAGFFTGNVAGGLMVGAALELFALETLPFGASRYPEWGSAAVVGGALFAEQRENVAGAMSTAVLAALATAWVGGWSMVQLRKLNARWARRRLDALARGSQRTVIGLQVAGMTADLVRGGVLTLLALLVMRPVVRASVSLWTVDGRVARAVVVGVAATVAAGAAWKIFHSIPGARWFFVGGLLAGLALLALR